MSPASQTDTAETNPHYQTSGNQMRTYQTPPKPDPSPGTNFQLYRKLTPRRVFDKFGIDQTKYSAFLLSSAVYPTGVKVSLMTDGHPFKCGFNVVERRNIEGSSSNGSGGSNDTATNRTLQKIPVVEFLETSGESRTSHSSRTSGNSDNMLYKNYNGINKIAFDASSSRKNELNVIERDKKDAFNNNIIHHNSTSVENAVILRGRPWEFFPRIGEQSDAVQQRVGSPTLLRRLQHQHRCQTTPLPFIPTPRKPMQGNRVKTEDKRKSSSVVPGRNSFTGTEVLSGVGIFNSHLKEVVPVKDGKDLSASRSCKMLRKNRLPSNLDATFGSLELSSLKNGSAHGQGNRKVTPMTLRDLLHLPEKNGIRNNGKVTKRSSEKGRSLKKDSGTYRHYAQSKLRKSVHTKRVLRSEVKPQMSVEPCLVYVGSVNSVRATKAASHGGSNYEFRRRLTLNSPVTDDGNLTPPSYWCSSADLKNSNTLQSIKVIGYTNQDLDVVKSPVLSRAKSANCGMDLVNKGKSLQYPSLSTGCNSETDHSQTPPINTIYVPQGERSSSSSEHSVIIDHD
ncbi:hypothetical protein BsWGS_28262 [Bradybaena similaris]